MIIFNFLALGEVVGDMYPNECGLKSIGKVSEVHVKDVLLLRDAVLYWNYTNETGKLLPPTTVDAILKISCLIFSNSSIIASQSLSDLRNKK